MFAIVWVIGMLASFCLLAVGARELSGELSISQSLFFRSAVGLICISLILIFKKQKILIKSSKFRLHLFRNIFHFAGQYGWFLGIGLLPLAEVFALEFTVPIWTLLIAATFLGEKVTGPKLISIFLGTVGVLIIVQPGVGIVDAASLIVLGSAICFSISHSSTKFLSATESPLTILFYMCALQLPMGFVLSLSTWTWPQGDQWFWLLVIGLTALSAHYCMAKALQYAEVTTVVTLDFFRLPLITLVGVLLYAEQFEISLLLGGLLMFVGNFVSISKLPRSADTSTVDELENEV